MKPTARAVRLPDHPAMVLRPFAWTAAMFFGAGFLGYVLVALAT